ncbi:DUF7144 family membrane protein [Planotetraspora kaengkrachanensis]|uniref:Membrane protein n=1 Tax=Planotetraspora kaengkrachanensis TaxID=575193 RepID=A0A8J3V957_9ACTN|nr:hypothetical protein [Planotetraspora kaengkrachanensis]GIG81929.1 membrane protein [Planotetraspora kaengkrachanensis]
MLGTWASERKTTRSGWLDFAAVLTVLVGVYNVIEGLTALVRPEYFLVTTEKILVFDFTAWGWIILLLGLVQVAVGLGIAVGRMWARAAGIALAFLIAIVHLAFLSAYPMWSIVSIALCVLVIYGLIVAPRNATG